jgi:hypothetical protein
VSKRLIYLVLWEESKPGGKADIHAAIDRDETVGLMERAAGETNPGFRPEVRSDQFHSQLPWPARASRVAKHWRAIATPGTMPRTARRMARRSTRRRKILSELPHAPHPSRRCTLGNEDRFSPRSLLANQLSRVWRPCSWLQRTPALMMLGAISTASFRPRSRPGQAVRSELLLGNGDSR